MISLIEMGLGDCFSGLGEWVGCHEQYYEGQRYYGKLKYLPSTQGAENIVDELSLLLTAGRIGSASKAIISEAYRGENDASSALRIAQKLVLVTPEFHSTTVFDKSSTERPDIEEPTSSNRSGYKAVR